mgnify:CR=1 FL=1
MFTVDEGTPLEREKNMLNKTVLATIKNAPIEKACFNHLYCLVMVDEDGTFFSFVDVMSDFYYNRKEWENRGYRFVNVWEF